MTTPLQELSDWTTAVFVGCGMEPTLAALGAESLVRAEGRGIATHGLIRVRTYAAKLRAGLLHPRPQINFEDSYGLVQVNADRGLGPAVGMVIADALISRAEATAAATAVIRDIGHLAALGMYALHCAERGMICLVLQATPRVMGMPGSRRGAIGNNPIAFASPMPAGPPLVLDIAAAEVARSRIARAARAGEAIPLGWGLDADGKPTTDAEAALQGAQLPMSGHKGLGIAMMVECLAGSLSGVRPPSPDSAEGVNAPSAAGAFMLVINPRLGAIGNGYFDHIEHWLADYRQASAEGARYPGERAAANEAAARANGVDLAQETLADLERLGAELGVPFKS